VTEIRSKKLTTTREKEMRFNAMKTIILLISAILFSTSAPAQETGKPLAEKLKGGNITINTSVRGCGADIKQHCDGLGKNAQKVFMCLAAYEDQLSPVPQPWITRSSPVNPMPTSIALQ
jgi:hypothetical protein